MLPLALLQEMLGHEYFVRVHPPVELETRLWCGPGVDAGATSGLAVL
jgi:hypothetical protein